MATSKEEQRQFIRKYKPAAETASKILFVPADVLLAQWAKEADWGKKESGNFNFAGIKSFNPNEPRKAVTTWEVLTPKQVATLKAQGKTVTPRAGVKDGYNIVDYFKSYESPEDFAKEYSKTLIKSYPQAVGSENIEDFAYAIDSGRAQGSDSGFRVYATDPNYAKGLAEIYKYNVLPRQNEIVDEDLGILRAPAKGDTKAAKELQTKLGLTGKDVDGDWGSKSQALLDAYNNNIRTKAESPVVNKPSSVAPPPFGIDPSDTNAIKSIQKISGLSGKDVDGVWGPQSAKAYAQHARGDYAQIDPRRVDAPTVEAVPEPTPIRNYAAEDIVNSNSQRMIQPIRPLERNYQYQTMEDLIGDKDLLNPLVGRF